MMSRKQLIRLLLYGIVGHCSIIVHKTILQTNDRRIIICSTNDLVWSNNFPIANQSMPNHTSDHCLIIADLVFIIFPIIIMITVCFVFFLLYCLKKLFFLVSYLHLHVKNKKTANVIILYAADSIINIIKSVL